VQSCAGASRPLNAYKYCSIHLDRYGGLDPCKATKTLIAHLRDGTLDRTQPLLPVGLGWVEGVSQPRDYIRHGTTALIAAFDVATGSVTAECKPRHRHQGFLSFLRRIDKGGTPEHDVHLIVDNYSAHNYNRVCSWLVQRLRFHVHYTPTYASWRNQVEPGWGSSPSERSDVAGSRAS
jgi:hypothetical protein